MIKKENIPLTSKRVINYKCGDCLHFGGKDKGIPKFEDVCSKLGVKHYADAPACFYPNVYALADKEPDRLFQIGLMFHDFSSRQKRILMALFKATPAFEKKYDLAFGMPVYFYLSRDYLSNYFLGFVLGVAVTGDPLVYVSSDLKGRQRGNPCTVSLYRSSIFTVTEFKKKRAELVERKRLKDPKPLSRDFKQPKKIEADYQPPSMETAPEEWFDRFDKRLASRTELSQDEDGSLVFKVERSKEKEED